MQGFAGAAVADEPNAALIGRDLLAAGGSAGDAAAAMFFALAVAKPASAGLMASGVCLAYDPTLDLHQAYRFQAPEGVRAMAAVHARFGLLPWRQVVGSAEALARFGMRLSKAFVEDWQTGRSPTDAAIGIYGARPTVGDQVRNVDLAGLLGQIRLNGAGAFYNGAAAKQLWSAMEGAGVPVDHAKWRTAIPASADSLRIEFGNHEAVFVPFAGSPGPGAAAAWPELEDLSMSALVQKAASTGAGATANPAAETSFVAADSLGGAVACTVTMGQPFGTGQMASGIFLTGPVMPSAGPVLVTNKPTKVFLAALSGTGASDGPSAVALEVLEHDKPLADAIAIPRSQSAIGQGRVNAIICMRGLPNYPESCAAAADPNGKGYAAIADSPK